MTQMKIQVLTVGELNVDLIMNRIDGMPEVGKEILAKNMTLTLGSSSAIFASNLSSLGVRTGFLGKIGKDSFGDMVKNSLYTKGVDTSHLIVDDSVATGITVVLNFEEDRAMVTYPGAMDHLIIRNISDQALSSAKHMHFSSLFLQKGIKPDIVSLYKSAKKLGLTTSLDTQWDPEEKWEFDAERLLPYVDVFLPNEKEFLALTGTSRIEDAYESIRKFANHVAVKRGNQGSTLFQKEGKVSDIPAFMNPDVVDCIGAGDSYNAGFISRFVKGYALEDCQRFGNLMGAINTTAPGGTGAFVSREHIANVAKEKFHVSI